MSSLPYYDFNKELYILRIEYFGGLLINKQTMAKYEISKYDEIFLLGLKKRILENDIIAMINNKYNIYFKPNVELFIQLHVIQQNIALNSKNTCEVEEIFNEIIKEIEIAEKKKFLRSPLELTIYPSLKCQLQCPFCFLQGKRNFTSKEYSSNQWIELIKTFISEGTLSVSILGGEPSLYQDIIPLINGLDKLGIRFTMTTNGQNWSEELYRCIINAKNITPIISMESFNTNQSKTQHKYLIDSDKTKRVIHKLYLSGKKCRVNTVYIGQKDKEIYDIIDFCIENNIEKYSIALYFGTDNTMPSIKDFSLFKERIKKYLRTKGDNCLYVTFEGCMIYSAYPDIDGSIVKTEYQKKQYGCECGNTILDILADGSMYSCASYISHGPIIGNAFEQNWKEVWDNSEILNQLRFQKCRDSICINCSLYHFCNGGCPAYKELKKQAVSSIYDDRCIIHKIKEDKNDE